LRARRCDVHRELAGKILVAAANLHEHAELVRGGMDVTFHDAALDRLEARRREDGDVLAELADQLLTLVVETVDRAYAVRVDRVEHLLREVPELRVLRDGLGLAADRDHRRVALRDAVADETLARLTTFALRSRRHPPLAQERTRGLDVSAGVDECALRVHHPRAGLVTKLLDEGCRDHRRR